MESTYIHALAAISPTLVSESLSGSALQRIALRQPDLLPVYGASELNSEGSSENRAVVFLSKYPTGFEIYEVAKGGATSLDVAQALAALGPELQGKKVVVSFTTNQFGSSEVGNDAYAGDYSDLHANELAFSPFLSMDLKHRAAQRMLDYPDTLKEDPLLTLALQWLSARSFGSDLLYQGLLPLGQLRTEAIRLQDHWQVLNYIWSHPTLNPAVTRQAAKIDWGALTVKAQTDQIIASSNDPYGVENTLWSSRYATFKLKTPGSGDQGYLNNFEKSKEWGDLEILLEVLKELGANPLIMSRPQNGQFLEASGVSAGARQFYYSTLEKTVFPFGMPVVDFKDHDTDKYFSIDQSPHTSRKGWVYVDAVLDAFYHNQPLTYAALDKAIPSATQTVYTGWLHTNGTKIFDSKNQVVFIHGINSSGMEWGAGHSWQAGQCIDVQYGCWSPPAASEYDNVGKSGFNLVRLPISWANLEPTAPSQQADGTLNHKYNQEYLLALDKIIQQFTSRKIMVILSMHQSGWSPFYQVEHEGSLIHGLGMPVWLYENTKPDVTTARQNFFYNQDNVQQGMVDAWKMIAHRYANNSGVVGADMLNEPGFKKKNPSDEPLLDKYTKLGKAIRDSNPNILLIFEDFPDDKMPAAPAFNNLLFSYHMYLEDWVPKGQSLTNEEIQRAAKWNIPVWLGEFDTLGPLSKPVGPTGWMQQTMSMLQFYKSHGIGWTYWAYQRTTKPLAGVDGQGPINQDLLSILQSGF